MKKKFNKKTLIIVAIILLLIIGGVVAYTFLGSNSDNNESGKLKYEDYVIYEGHKGSLEKYDPSMTVDGHTKSENAYYITGKISTKDDKEFSVITFNVYDKDDKLLGTAVAGLNELKKDVKYDFRAIALVDAKDLEKIDYYKLKSVELG